MFLYHLYGNKYESLIKMKKVKEQGLHPKLTSMYLGTGGGGDFYPDIMERVRLRSPGAEWINFDVGIVVTLSPYDFKNYLRFPIFTNKIMVFDRDITTKLFSYIEDEYVIDESGIAGTMIEPGTPSKEELVKQYWGSGVTLENYMKNKPFSNTEIMVFERVPKNQLTLISE
ncbi:hypothetical protein [Alkalicoccobacillus porphyridii]|uniref:Uncharacterized protein n=1 Tax=Alkalicoccobacillus porphyridii TaxID=2597270 RepID=A0A553ZTI6_9BACI|nr:hypothetical protein [Alkalicoccobacillus porphyridii]TSB44787.1 hypothetical protein FN960_19480 [Alkalicoccobacillus porphyridii]